jgi:orotidine-5'-phosphate decarboxylase
MLPVEKILKAQQANRSLICLGLDLDPKKMPKENAASLKGIFDFAQAIIEATSDQVCAYKPNLAFYEAMGSDGLALLQLIIERIPDKIPVIVDGKRNDIGNTAVQYANFLFDYLKADWVTINPYMGYDSMRPFLERKDKGAFVLCLTSNAGSKDFQLLNVEGRPLYEIVAERVNYWNKDDNCGLVVGATHPEQLEGIRALAGDMPILIPGVGAQGGSLEKAITAGTDNFKKPAVINVSRSVLFASHGEDFAQKARQELVKLNASVTRVRYGDQNGKRSDNERSEPAQEAISVAGVSPSQPESKPSPQPETAPTTTPDQTGDSQAPSNNQTQPPASPQASQDSRPAPHGQPPRNEQPGHDSSSRPPQQAQPSPPRLPIQQRPLGPPPDPKPGAAADTDSTEETSSDYESKSE